MSVQWGLGIGDWGLGIGDWAQSPIPEHGVLSKFNPRTAILKAGTQLHPAVSPLKHDIKYLQDV